MESSSSHTAPSSPSCTTPSASSCLSSQLLDDQLENIQYVQDVCSFSQTKMINNDGDGDDDHDGSDDDISKRNEHTLVDASNKVVDEDDATEHDDNDDDDNSNTVQRKKETDVLEPQKTSTNDGIVSSSANKSKEESSSSDDDFYSVKATEDENDVIVIEMEGNNNNNDSNDLAVNGNDSGPKNEHDIAASDNDGQDFDSTVEEVVLSPSRSYDDDEKNDNYDSTIIKDDDDENSTNNLEYDNTSNASCISISLPSQNSSPPSSTPPSPTYTYPPPPPSSSSSTSSLSSTYTPPTTTPPLPPTLLTLPPLPTLFHAPTTPYLDNPPPPLTTPTHLQHEHRIFLHALLTLLHERELIGVPSHPNDPSTIIKTGRLKKRNSLHKKTSSFIRHFKTKYIEIRKGLFSYWDESPRHRRRPSTTHGTKRRRKRSRRRRTDWELRTSSCRVGIIENKRYYGVYFGWELVVEGGAVRSVWLCRTEEERDGWVEAVREGMIGFRDGMQGGGEVAGRSLAGWNGSRSLGDEEEKFWEDEGDGKEWERVRQNIQESKSLSDYRAIWDDIGGSSWTLPLSFFTQFNDDQLLSPPCDDDNNCDTPSNKNNLSTSTHTSTTTTPPLPLLLHLKNRHVTINNHTIDGNSPMGPERIIGAFIRCILEYDKSYIPPSPRRVRKTFDSSEEEPEERRTVPLSDVQAAEYARDILRVDAAQSGCDDGIASLLSRGVTSLLSTDFVDLIPQSTSDEEEETDDGATMPRLSFTVSHVSNDDDDSVKSKNKEILSPVAASRVVDDEDDEDDDEEEVVVCHEGVLELRSSVDLPWKESYVTLSSDGILRFFDSRPTDNTTAAAVEFVVVNATVTDGWNDVGGENDEDSEKEEEMTVLHLTSGDDSKQERYLRFDTTEEFLTWRDAVRKASLSLPLDFHRDDDDSDDDEEEEEASLSDADDSSNDEDDDDEDDVPMRQNNTSSLLKLPSGGSSFMKDMFRGATGMGRDHHHHIFPPLLPRRASTGDAPTKNVSTTSTTTPTTQPHSSSLPIPSPLSSSPFFGSFKISKEKVTNEKLKNNDRKGEWDTKSKISMEDDNVKNNIPNVVETNNNNNATGSTNSITSKLIKHVTTTDESQKQQRTKMMSHSAPHSPIVNKSNTTPQISPGAAAATTLTSFPKLNPPSFMKKTRSKLISKQQQQQQQKYQAVDGHETVILTGTTAAAAAVAASTTPTAGSPTTETIPHHHTTTTALSTHSSSRRLNKVLGDMLRGALRSGMCLANDDGVLKENQSGNNNVVDVDDVVVVNYEDVDDVKFIPPLPFGDEQGRGAGGGDDMMGVTTTGGGVKEGVVTSRSKSPDGTTLTLSPPPPPPPTPTPSMGSTFGVLTTAAAAAPLLPPLDENKKTNENNNNNDATLTKKPSKRSSQTLFFPSFKTSDSNNSNHQNTTTTTNNSSNDAVLTSSVSSHLTPLSRKINASGGKFMKATENIFRGKSRRNEVMDTTAAGAATGELLATPVVSSLPQGNDEMASGAIASLQQDNEQHLLHSLTPSESQQQITPPPPSSTNAPPPPSRNDRLKIGAHSSGKIFKAIHRLQHPTKRGRSLFRNNKHLRSKSLDSSIREMASIKENLSSSSSSSFDEEDDDSSVEQQQPLLTKQSVVDESKNESTPRSTDRRHHRRLKSHPSPTGESNETTDIFFVTPPLPHASSTTTTGGGNNDDAAAAALRRDHLIKSLSIIPNKLKSWTNSVSEHFDPAVVAAQQQQQEPQQQQQHPMSQPPSSFRGRNKQQRRVVKKTKDGKRRSRSVDSISKQKMKDVMSRRPGDVLSSSLGRSKSAKFGFSSGSGMVVVGGGVNVTGGDGVVDTTSAAAAGSNNGGCGGGIMATPPRLKKPSGRLFVGGGRSNNNGSRNKDSGMLSHYDNEWRPVMPSVKIVLEVRGIWKVVERPRQQQQEKKKDDDDEGDEDKIEQEVEDNEEGEALTTIATTPPTSWATVEAKFCQIFYLSSGGMERGDELVMVQFFNGEKGRRR